MTTAQDLAEAIQDELDHSEFNGHTMAPGQGIMGYPPEPGVRVAGIEAVLERFDLLRPERAKR